MFMRSWTVCVALRVEVGLSSAGVTKREVYTGGVALDSTVCNKTERGNLVLQSILGQCRITDVYFPYVHSTMERSFATILAV